jgi:hypothetical protein
MEWKSCVEDSIIDCRRSSLASLFERSAVAVDASVGSFSAAVELFILFDSR